MGSGRQWQAAKPSVWDQRPQPTSITPRLWACVDGAHLWAQRPKGRPVASLGVLFPCPGQGGPGRSGGTLAVLPAEAASQVEGQGWGPLMGVCLGF